jgi:ElaB/YqjD/DUF883 family membrane-anchored ribosome-binding protein
MSSTSLATANEHARQSAEELRRQMRSIRREMGEDLDEIAWQAERLLDWRYYVRQHPWKLAGVAACLGCFVAWRLTKRSTAAAKNIQHGQPTPVKPPHPDQPKRTKSLLLTSLLFLGGDMLLRAALNFAGEQMGKVLQQRVAKDQPLPVEAAFVGWPERTETAGPEQGGSIPIRDEQPSKTMAETC